MGRAAILSPEERVELLEGEVIVMSPIGNRHAACGTKIPLYADAGIREVWLVDLEHDRIEAYTEPVPGDYRSTRRYAPGESLTPSALPDLKVEVAEIIPARPAG